MLRMKRMARLLLLVALSAALMLPQSLSVSAAADGKRYVLTKIVEAAIDGYTYEDRVAMMKGYYEQEIAKGMFFNYDWYMEDGKFYYHIQHQYDGKIYPPHDKITEDLTMLFSKPEGIVPGTSVKVPFTLGWKGINKAPSGSLGSFQVLLFAGDDPANMQQKAGENYYLADNDDLQGEFVYKLDENHDYKYITLYIFGGNFYAGGLGYGYIYELMDAPDEAGQGAVTASPATESTAEAFASGSRLMWQPTSGLGYRLFRSESKSSLGISVTDFYITGTSYADVNIEPNTTYYYTVKPVLAEANPFNGTEEKLGSAIATFTVKTGDQTYKPGSYKHFIMLKLDSPSMSVDGISQEVDPGRGTAPLTIAGRTMVPIRSVVEAMGGTVEWDGASQKITLKARGNTVEMWMGKTDIRINGVAKKMDVAPASKNSRTFVPVRFAAENLNCKVDWINSTKEAIIVYEE